MRKIHDSVLTVISKLKDKIIPLVKGVGNLAIISLMLLIFRIDFRE